MRAHVLAGDRCQRRHHRQTADRAAAVTEEIRKGGGEAKFVLGDVTSRGWIECVIEGGNRLRRHRYLVNNARHPLKRSPNRWFEPPFRNDRRLPSGTRIAAVSMGPGFTPAMKERGGGPFDQVSSRNAYLPHANLPDYGAAKAADLKQRDAQTVIRSWLELE